MKVILKLILILGCAVSNAWCATFTCIPAPIKIQDKNFILPGPDPAHKHASQVYFFYNISKQSLWLDHPVEHRSASAGWSSYIQPQRWSAMLVDRQNFAVSCAQIKPGEVNYQSCEKVIKVCIPKADSFNAKRKGSYWLVEDKAWTDLLQGLEKRGFKVN